MEWREAFLIKHFSDVEEGSGCSSLPKATLIDVAGFDQVVEMGLETSIVNLLDIRVYQLLVLG